MAQAKPSHLADPRRRAVDRLVARFRDGAHAVMQPLLLLDPPGYGASRILADFVEELRVDPTLIAGFKLGTIAERPDAIDTLSALLVEIAAAACADGNIAGWRRRMLDWQRHREPSGFREEIDRFLTDTFTRIPGVILCVPRIDKTLAQLSSLSPREDWQLRGYITNYPIRLVATAPSRLRTTGDDAFFQTFWNIAPELYADGDFSALAARMRLSKQAEANLREVSAQLGDRVDLVERAAGLLAVTPQLTAQRIIREIAQAPPAALLEQLGLVSRQALKILTHVASFAYPVDAGTIGRAANLSGNIVSSQMGRLADHGLIKVSRSAGRDRRYEFADPVSQRLYAAMVDALEVDQDRLIDSQAS